MPFAVRAVRFSVIALSFVLFILLFLSSFNSINYAPIPKKIEIVVETPVLSFHVEEPELTNNTIVDTLSSDYDIAVTHPSLKWTDQDLAFFTSAAGEAIFSQLAVIPEAHTVPDFAKMTAAERLFKSLFHYFDGILTQSPTLDPAHDPHYQQAWDLYQRLESTLYPWIHPYWENVFHINNQTQGQGIILCVGNGQFKFAASTIRALREVLHCTLPIEIFFIRDNDLSLAKRSYLTSEFKDITLRKLEDYVGKYYTRFGGWAMKPFAMLASRFTEMIMMDADVFFLQEPSRLFQDKGYKATGSLFFYDRTLFPNWEKGPDWLRSFLSTASPLVPNTRWFKGTSSHEQESGVVVMNKKQSLLGLLSTCKLNGITERDEVVYKHVHGDKETFWVGFEIMQTPYAFVKSFGAVIGGMGRGGEDGEPTQVCGVHLHLDTKEEPLWINGGLYRDKYKDSPEYLEFSHYAQGEDWEFATHCIKDTDKISVLSDKQRQIALASIEIDKERIKHEVLVDQGLWKSEKENK